MRFLAVLFVLAMVLVVSAAPKNVPQYDPQAAAEFNSQQSSKRSLQDAVHQWLNPDKVKRDFATAFHEWLHPEDASKLKKRGSAGDSAFGFVRDWKTAAEKKFGLVPKKQ